MKNRVIYLLTMVLMLTISACAVQPQNTEKQEELRLNVNEGEWNNMSPSEKAEAIGSYN